jgi:hypothetical protein
MKFLTTEKSYLAYIEYWNDKLKQMSMAMDKAPAAAKTKNKK